jgi:hypothetical protein
LAGKNFKAKIHEEKMRTDDINFYIAEQKLKLNTTMGFVASFTTIWEGSIIHIMYNNFSGEIMQIWPEDIIPVEDVGTLRFIIDNFYKFYADDVDKL